ncbi:MAG: hypothetical protein OEZ41_13070, partial [Nitrospirota bacterium]|nr:hypothetical protein [Nitrospirota bacterium]
CDKGEACRLEMSFTPVRCAVSTKSVAIVDVCDDLHVRGIAGVMGVRNFKNHFKARNVRRPIAAST